MGVNTTINFGNDVYKEMKTFHINYASRHSRTRDAVKLTVCVSVCLSCSSCNCSTVAMRQKLTASIGF